jgi:hypothetical protein
MGTKQLYRVTEKLTVAQQLTNSRYFMESGHQRDDEGLPHDTVSSQMTPPNLIPYFSTIKYQLAVNTLNKK